MQVFFDSFKLILFLYTVSVLLASCSENRANKTDISATATEKAPVTTEIAEQKSFYSELFSNGKIQSEEMSEIRFEISGKISDVSVKQGQSVRKGEVLALLDLTNSEIEYERAKINVKKAKTEFENLLIGQGYNIEDTAKILKTQLEIALMKSGYATELLNLKEAKAKYESSTVKAPFSGQIANVKFQKHNSVNNGDVFCTLINNTRLAVNFALFESERKTIYENQEVEIITVGGQIFKARISQINPIIDANGQFQVKALLSKFDEQAVVGMSVKVIVKTKIPNQIVILRSALVTRQNRDVVFTCVANKAQWNDVVISSENSDFYAVASGLKVGDTIITSGNVNLSHDAEIEIIENKK
jgi:RND family efflux transporter MFP subunit